MTSTYARPVIWTACSLIALVGLAGVATATVLLSQTVTDPSDEWDGLAYFLAALAGGLGLILVLVAAGVSLLARRHVRGAGVTLIGVGATSALLGTVTSPMIGSVLTTGPVLGGLLVAGLGFAAALGVERAVDSPRD